MINLRYLGIVNKPFRSLSAGTMLVLALLLAPGMTLFTHACQMMGVGEVSLEAVTCCGDKDHDDHTSQADVVKATGCCTSTSVQLTTGPNIRVEGPAVAYVATAILAKPQPWVSNTPDQPNQFVLPPQDDFRSRHRAVLAVHCRWQV